MKILVTGGAGFIGSHIVDQLCLLGHEVFVLDNLSTGRIEQLNLKAKLWPYNLNDEQVGWLLKHFKPEIVYHQAAQTDVGRSLINPVLDGQSNILGSIKLFNACVEAGVRKIVYASSAALYGTPQYLPIDEKHPVAPLSFYGVSKYVPEIYLRLFNELFNLDYTILRYANVYGPRQNSQGEGGVIAIFSDRINSKLPPIIFGDGEQTRDFVYVNDVVAANLAAIDHGSKQIINISSNTSTSLNNLLGIFHSVLQQEVVCQYEHRRQGDIMHSCLNPQLAKIALGWEACTNLKQGVTETMNYFNQKQRQV